MFIETTPDQPAPAQELSIPKPAAAKRQKAKPKTKHSFEDLYKAVSAWEPNDVTATRRLLSSELMLLLGDQGFSFIKACIPSIIVEGQYPIDLMHYHHEQDIYEFLTRMMWMQQEYGYALGIFLGASDEAAAVQIEEACGSLLQEERNCLVILM
jgi:hypothetical protein